MLDLPGCQSPRVACASTPRPPRPPAPRRPVLPEPSAPRREEMPPRLGYCRSGRDMEPPAPRGPASAQLQETEHTTTVQLALGHAPWRGAPCAASRSRLACCRREGGVVGLYDLTPGIRASGDDATVASTSPTRSVMSVPWRLARSPRAWCGRALTRSLPGRLGRLPVRRLPPRHRRAPAPAPPRARHSRLPPRQLRQYRRWLSFPLPSLGRHSPQMFLLSGPNST